MFHVKDLLLIVPSRGRQEKIVSFKKYFDMNSKFTDLCLGLDDDEYETYPNFDDVIYEINPNMKLVPKLNTIALKYCSEYKYIGFMGDDHWIKTPSWDQKILRKIHGIDYGMVYGNDLLQGEALPTAIVMDSRIIKKLGYMCPPSLEHLYIDNFWLDLGKSLKTIKYCPEVIIEHMHFSAGKSDIDDMYAVSNHADSYKKDLKAYQNYLASDFKNDIKKIKS